MALILDENGKLINVSNKSIDSLKRESFKHSNENILKEDSEEPENFLDSLEELEDVEEDDLSSEPSDLDQNALEVAMLYMQFKTIFTSTFGEDDCQDAFLQIEDFFSSKGLDITKDLAGLDDEGEIPGMESSEQSIVTSEVEEI